MDPKVTKFMRMLEVDNIRSFASIGMYLKVKGLTRRYANSTLVDYVWRLLRVLRATTPKISPVMIEMYYKLWLSLGGKPK